MYQQHFNDGGDEGFTLHRLHLPRWEHSKLLLVAAGLSIFEPGLSLRPKLQIARAPRCRSRGCDADNTSNLALR